MHCIKQPFYPSLKQTNGQRQLSIDSFYAPHSFHKQPIIHILPNLMMFFFFK